MKSPISRLLPCLLALAWLLAPVVAGAQQAALPDPNAWLNAAMQAVQMIDQNKAGDLWEGGSAEMKRRVAKNDFIAGIKKLRGADAISAREWMSIERSQFGTRPDVPAGQYLSVRMRAMSGKRAVVELVTFRQEPDGGWRWMGYALQ